MSLISRIGDAIKIGADFTAEFVLREGIAQVEDLGNALSRRYGSQYTFTPRVIEALLNRVEQAQLAADILENNGFVPRSSIPRAGSRGDNADAGILHSAYRYHTSVTVSDGEDDKTITVLVDSGTNLSHDELTRLAIEQANNIDAPGFGSLVFADIADRPGSTFEVKVHTIFRAT